MIEQIEELKKYIFINNLQNKVISYFWKAFNNWKKDYEEIYEETFHNISEDHLDIIFHTIGLRLSEWPECENNYITLSLNIVYKNRKIGEYIYWHSLSGDENDDDDFLKI